MRAWKIPCRNQARNLQNQKVRMSSLQCPQALPNRATPPIRAVIAEASAGAAAVAVGVAMAVTVDRNEAETADQIVVATAEMIGLPSRASRAPLSPLRRVPRNSIGLSLLGRLRDTPRWYCRESRFPSTAATRLRRWPNRSTRKC